MKRLVAEIAARVRDAVQGAASSLHHSNAELRIVFHGPPMEFLQRVFDELVEGGGIEARLSGGATILFPLLLQLEQLAPGKANPLIGQSGLCDESHLLTLRNSPTSPRFVALVPPGRHRSLSVSSATVDLGVSVDSNAGNATIEQWWRDDFIQALVEKALDRTTWASESERDQGRRLVEHSVRAADEAERHGSSRRRPWAVLSRIHSINGSESKFGTLLSLACGFPPLADGTIKAQEQIDVLEQLADALVDSGFRPGIERLKERAEGEDIQALDQCLDHLLKSCEVPTAFPRATPFFYSPSQGDEIGEAPTWWPRLTVERWAELLEGDRQPKGALQIRCTNSIIPPSKGVNALVVSGVELEIGLPDDAPSPVDVVVKREAGGAAHRQHWDMRLAPNALISDPAVPIHNSAARYSVETPQLRKATLRVISLQTWGAGVFVFCRTATKTSPPKKAKQNRDQVSFECSLVLSGQGRHYIDLYVGPGVDVGAIADGRDAGALQDGPRQSPVSRVSEIAFGFEVEATQECQYDLAFSRGEKQEKLRLQISCDESEAEGCSSEFERLIRLNRGGEDGRGTADVQIDRQARITDLQTWMLEESRVDRSYYPMVLAPDYAMVWRPPEWKTKDDSIFSNGRFVHDPRPTLDEMQPPGAFAQARAAIAKRLRREDGSGLAESAPLGIWLASEPGFSELVEEYVRSYLEWLDSSPDAAAWVDVVLVNSLEGDRRTLVQEPDALLISPLHPLRIGWQCLAQRALYLAYHRNAPCPAASILDPDCLPDTVALPLRAATGEIRRQVFLSLECGSDYWAVLWNASRFDKLAAREAQTPPLDQEFGLPIGGVSSAFSVSQVHRALDDVSSMLSAKSVLNIAIDSAAGQSSACNEGVVSWCRTHLGTSETQSNASASLGERLVQIHDGRKASARPEDAEISNLAEDTLNAVRWFGSIPKDIRPDLGIIAQLKITNPAIEKIDIASPVGTGALLRHRVRRQLRAGDGAFLSESRAGVAGPPSGEGLADKVMLGVVRLENLADVRFGYTFAPSVHAIQDMLQVKKADYAAVSSSAVDPACFLGDWLRDTYLWDYDLPSYSHRAGDTNGYYLLSRVKDIDRDTLRDVLGRIPGCEELADDFLADTILEVARRGIPTVRGLAGGDTGATGDLGLLVASRLLQDEFRRSGTGSSLLPAISVEGGTHRLAIVVPVDPFRGYFDALQRATTLDALLRPDLIVAGIEISDSAVRCRLTPVEVKFRSQDVMPTAASKEALQQAGSLSRLLKAMQERGEQQDLLIWKLALQHLVLSLIGYGFRVYSQHRTASLQPKEWSACHQRFVEAVVSDELDLEIDQIGRLVVVDRSPTSAPRDSDDDGFKETVVLSAKSARDIVRSLPTNLYTDIRNAIGDWRLMPGREPRTDLGPRHAQQPQPPASPEGQAIAPPSPPPPVYPEPVVATAPLSPAGDADAPAPTSGLVLKVGATVDGFRSEPMTLNLSDTRLNQLNIGVVGDLGTGKTQLLKSLVYQIAMGGASNGGVKPRVLIFDYKKDYSADDFVSAVGARVVKPHRLPINIFDVAGAGESLTPWLDRFKFFSDVLDKVFSGIGPVQRQQLKQAVRQAYEECESVSRQPTIYDVHAKYRALLGNKTDSPLSIIDDLVDMEMFARDPGPAANFDKFLDGVVVIALNALGQDDRTKNMLVAIMLNMFYEHMLKIPKRPYRGNEPQLRTIDSFLLVDEADNIMRYEFDVLRKLLLQGREFGVGVILASQYLRHFKAGATDYREPLLSWFLHKVPNVTPQELGALGLSSDISELADRIKTLANHNCLYKTVGIGGDVIRGLPFFELNGRA